MVENNSTGINAVEVRALFMNEQKKFYKQSKKLFRFKTDLSARLIFGRYLKTIFFGIPTRPAIFSESYF